MKPLLLLAAGGHKPPPLVDFDYTVAIQLGIFLLLLVVLTRFVFRPYLALRAERMKNIDGAREEAQSVGSVAAEKLARYEDQIAATRKEAAAVRTQLRAEGEGRAAEVVSTAHTEAGARVESARQKIEKSAQAAQLALRSRAEQIASSIASKLLGREV
jgi:F0F1-type ATP synthase membrane subunit b/b'